MPKKVTKKESVKHLAITPPNEQIGEFHIKGTDPYVQNNFNGKVKKQIKDRQLLGSVGKKNTKKEPKDFMQRYKDSMHISTVGWYGIPATAFRRAAVSACRLCGFKMVLAKLSIFVEADGYDKEDGTPLVRIIKGEPHYSEHGVVLASGVRDITARAMWDPGWEAKVRIRFDADQFSLEDVANLMLRIGRQVGIGEGRPDSKNSCGMGWGLFTLIEEANKKKRKVRKAG